MTIADLATCVSQRWSPQVGDPHVMGWVTVVAYGVTGLLALAVAGGRVGQRRRGVTFWLIVAVLIFALAVNKQLDLQSALTATGRCIAKAQGWYAERRIVQQVFILALTSGAALLLLTVLYFMRHQLRRNLLALFGVFLVGTFVLVRAVGFHGFDAFLGSTFHDIRMNWLLELSGLVLISANAAALLATARTGNEDKGSGAGTSGERD